MKNKFEKWRQSGRWFLGRGWNRARPNSAKRSRKFCRNVSRKIHCAARFLKMTAMKNDSQKNHCGKVAVSSCVFSALGRRKILPKWEPLEKFELCNGLHKRSRNFR